MKNQQTIRYQVSDETKRRIKELAELWQVRPAIAVEMAVLIALAHQERPDSLQQQLDRMEAILLAFFPEGS